MTLHNYSMLNPMQPLPDLQTGCSQIFCLPFVCRLEFVTSSAFPTLLLLWRITG